MAGILASFQQACGGSAVLPFVDVVLRGIGRVMLPNNPPSGALFLVAIAWGSFWDGAPEVLIGGFALLATANLIRTVGIWASATPER